MHYRARGIITTDNRNIVLIVPIRPISNSVILSYSKGQGKRRWAPSIFYANNLKQYYLGIIIIVKRKICYPIRI